MFMSRGMGVVVVKMKARRIAGGGLGSKLEKWELVVRGNQILDWFKEV